MINSVIIPLIKTKNGDLTDKDKHRLITLSSKIFNVFEHIMLNLIDKQLSNWIKISSFNRHYVFTEFIEHLKKSIFC